MPTIQKSPAGYRDVLGLVGSDQAPIDVGRELQPVMESLPFYLARNQQIESVSAAAATLNTTAALVTLNVPQGQAWYMYGVGGRINAISAAVSILRFSIEVSTQTNVVTTVASYKEDQTLNPTEEIRFGYWFPQPVILVHGSSLQLLNNYPKTRTADVTLKAIVSTLNAQ